MSLKCAICDYSAKIQGGIIQGEGQGEPKIVCGLHLDPTGENLRDKEVAGDWKVLQTWGYESKDIRVVKLWDQGMERFNQSGEKGAGWKIVATIGDATLEISCVPRGNNYVKTKPETPDSHKVDSEIPLSNSFIHDKLEWKTKDGDNTVPALSNSPWAWSFRAARDGAQTKLQAELQSAIEKAPETKFILDDMTYTIGGRDKALFNRHKEESK